MVKTRTMGSERYHMEEKKHMRGNWGGGFCGTEKQMKRNDCNTTHIKKKCTRLTCKTDLYPWQMQLESLKIQNWFCKAHIIQ
jgi:hypothetical protein